MVTVPFRCPASTTLFQGLCPSTSQLPSFVRCCATISPVDVS